jgi:hypothetical protein
VLADPRGHYANPSPSSSWSTSASGSFRNAPNPRQVFGHTEEAKQSQTVLDIDNGGTTEIIYVFCIMYLNNISKITLLMFLKLNNFTLYLPVHILSMHCISLQ